MRHLLLLMLTYSAFILDAGIGSWSMPTGTAPLFLYMTAAIALLLCDGAKAVWWAAFIGLLIDVLSNGRLGLNVVLLANLTFFAQVFGTRDLRDSVFAGGAVVWCFVTIACFCSQTLTRLLQGEALNLQYLVQYAAGRAGGSAIVFLIVLLSWRTVIGLLRLVLPSVKVGRDGRKWAAGGA